MDILIISPNYARKYNHVHEHMRIEIASSYANKVIFYGPGHKHFNGSVPQNVKSFYDEYGPFDLVMIFHPKHVRNFEGIEDIVDIPKVCTINDYLPRCYNQKNALLTKWGIDLVFLNQRFCVNYAEGMQQACMLPQKLKIKYLPFAVDTDYFSMVNERKRSLDVVTISSGQTDVYPNRKAIVNILNSLDGLNVMARIAHSYKARIMWQDYVDLLNDAKIGVVSTDKNRCVHLKHFEYPACGAMLLCDRANDLEHLGFVNMENMVYFDGLVDFENKVFDMIYDDINRKRIAKNGYKLIQKRHTIKIRAREMMSIIRQEL